MAKPIPTMAAAPAVSKLEPCREFILEMRGRGATYVGITTELMLRYHVRTSISSLCQFTRRERAGRPEVDATPAAVVRLRDSGRTSAEIGRPTTYSRPLAMNEPNKRLMRLAPTALVAATLFVLAHAPVASAAVVYSQTPTGADAFAVSDRNQGTNGLRHADDFTLASAATVRSLTWRGTYATTNTLTFPLSFKLTIYADTGAGLPNANNVLIDTPVAFASASFIQAVGTSFGSTLYEFRANFDADLTLAAGTRYWLSVMADTTNDADDNWRWAGAGTSVNQARQLNVAANSAFGSTPIAPLYYVLDDAAAPAGVPEPSTWAMIAGGLLTLIGLQHVRNKSHRQKALCALVKL